MTVLTRVAAVALTLLLAACASLAASTGSTAEQVAADVHTQAQTAYLTSEAALNGSPKSALRVVLEESERHVTDALTELEQLQGDHTELTSLAEDTLRAVRDLKTAVADDDRAAIETAGAAATAAADGLEAWSALL